MKRKRDKTNYEFINDSFAISWFDIMNPEHRQSNGNHPPARYRGSGPPRGRGRRGRGGTHNHYRDNRPGDYPFPSSEPYPPPRPRWEPYYPRTSHHSRPNDNRRRMSTQEDHHNQKSRTQEASPSRPPKHFSSAREGTSRDKRNPAHTRQRSSNHPRRMDTTERPRTQNSPTPQPSTLPPPTQTASPETTGSSSSTASIPLSIRVQDPWHLQYCLEKERLSAPEDSKPESLYFFGDDRTKGVYETRSSPRKFTSAYSPHQIFGTAPERHAELRDVPVTFSQIWNREMILKKWIRHSQDHHGALELENQEFKIQLQRHHVPGTFFVARDGGSLNINVLSLVFPDVYFRMVDMEGQEFKRSLENVYDLKRRMEIAESQTIVVFKGIDGAEITVEIEGKSSSCRLRGHGMPRKWDGSDRGDLLIELVREAK